MTQEFDNQRDYRGWVEDAATERSGRISAELVSAFGPVVSLKSVEVIRFEDVSAEMLADILFQHPILLKPIITVCNVAARAIERDLGIKGLNTYRPRLQKDSALVLAGYLKSFLPPELEVPAIVQLDRAEFISKEVRKLKGQWEKRVTSALSRLAAVKFKKRRFVSGGDEFEVDAASPPAGEAIRFGIDIKRIEARRDIHKRCDEIVNKGAHLKAVFPGAKFAAVIYYPFTSEHANVVSRLQSSSVDLILFADVSEESIESAVRLLLSKFGIMK